MPAHASPAALARARSAMGTLPSLRKITKRDILAKIPDGYPPRTPQAEKQQKSSASKEIVTNRQFDGAPVFGRAAVVAAAAAGRDILPVGTTLRVYWEGNDEWFETKILGHRAQLSNGQVVDGEVLDGFLTFKHLCAYDGGELEHDLGQMEYEIILLLPMEHLGQSAAGEPEQQQQQQQPSQSHGAGLHDSSRPCNTSDDQENAMQYAHNVPDVVGDRSFGAKGVPMRPKRRPIRPAEEERAMRI
jgi:hypothetical protein